MTEPPRSTHAAPTGLSPERLVYMVTSDEHCAAHIAQQISHFGYFAQYVPFIKSIPNTHSDQNPVTVLIDVSSGSAQLYDDPTFADIRALHRYYPNIIFISDRDDQATRMRSIQAGGAAFFTKPVNIVPLIDKLDSLNRQLSDAQPHRVLILENPPAIASYYQMLLKMSGIDAEIVSDPFSTLDHLREFRPDLILMNTYLSKIDVTDLVRVIRQIDDFVSIPIIFLSNEEDYKKRNEFLDLGGDDYLVMPTAASHLIGVVTSRLERSKTLRSYMVRDSLTNLLNHTAFRSILTQEVNRCKRQNAQLALAMLDIDHFKQVNDLYGHAAGDSALKVLSYLLQQRLRRSDIIGRYGGDEFVALLLDCETERATKIMDEIRQHFSEIEFYPNRSKPLSLTFSCGIATFPAFKSAESLSDMADQALYSAKAGQRNQVVAIPTI